MTQVLTTLPFSGFYESIHDQFFDDWLDSESIELKEPDATNIYSLFYSQIDFKKLRAEYAKGYVEQVSQELGTTITFEKLTSPREYNFSTDIITAYMPLSYFEAELAKIDRVQWCEFVAEKCTSCDGFISFYPANFEDWPPLSEWVEAQRGLLLEFIFNIDECELMESKMRNGFMDELIFNNCTKKFSDFYNKVRA